MQYGLIGEHLSHSFSKEIHTALAGYPYILKEIPKDGVETFMREKAFSGINVTIPYKQTVMPFLDEIDPAAKVIGAVNTVVNRDKRLYGYNTDFGGMAALIQRMGVSLTNKKVLILGTGGTSNTAQAVATHLGAKSIFKVSRTAGDNVLTYGEALITHTDTDILINTTPCGMFGNASGYPIDPQAFPHLSGVIDAIYHPLRSALVLRAREMGVPAQGGLYMLVMQAALAAQHFTGKTWDTDTIHTVYYNTLKSKENIVLIGMPASGKSTVGKALAAKLSRPFIDTDEEIIKRAGCDIPTIFKTKGEQAFRDLESAVIADVATQSGAVIATGGGAILRCENVHALRANGRLLFLDRPLAQLIPTNDRPLASSIDAIRERYNERYPLYTKTADVTVPADGTVAEVTDMTLAAFETCVKEG